MEAWIVCLISPVIFKHNLVRLFSLEYLVKGFLTDASVLPF